MIQSMTHSRKNLGLVLDASFEDPLRPIHAGSGLGNCRGCSRNGGAVAGALGWVTVDDNPLRAGLGFVDTPRAGVAVGIALGIFGAVVAWPRVKPHARKLKNKIVRRFR